MSRKESFDRDGFVVVPALFHAEDTRRISAGTDEIQAQPDTPGRAMIERDPTKTYTFRV